MEELSKTLTGLLSAAGISVLWINIPGHEIFALKMKTLTSPTGEPEKSPLAFIEHYHFGLTSMTIARHVKKYSSYLDGFGIGMILSEFFGPNPFGIGKTETEWKGNITLTSLLGGMLLISLGR